MAKTYPVKVDGRAYQVRYQRRRYGRSTCYTWAYIVHSDGSETGLGDPMPSTYWRVDELAHAIRCAIPV